MPPFERDGTPGKFVVRAVSARSAARVGRRPRRPAIRFPRRARVAGLGLSALCLLAAPGPGAAQALDVIPLVGIHAPLNDLGEVRTATGDPLRLERPESSLALGAAIEVGLGTGFGIRGDFLLGTSADVPLEGSGCPGCDVDVSTLVLAGSAVIRPLAGIPFVRPYFLLGGGIRRFDLDVDDLREAGFQDPEDEQSRAVVRLGAGIDVDLGLLEALVEVSDFIGDFEPRAGEGELKHGAFLLVGLRL